MTERFDAVVIGGGMSGLPLALRMAKHGRVGLIERDRLGGTCLNRGCIPTKTMIASADVAQSARQAVDFGVHLSEPVVDLGQVVDRKDDLVESIRTGSYRAVSKRADLELIEGHATIAGPNRIAVNGTTISADRIFLNTGTRDSMSGIEGLDDVDYFTSRTILELRELPEHLVVVGGGFIGCEFAQMFRRFGSRVTIVQRSNRLLPSEDPDISAAVHKGFRSEGIEVITDTSCTHATPDAFGITVSCSGNDNVDITGTHLLVATGRRPNSDTLGLDTIDITPNSSGYIDVDENLRPPTTQDVWVLGDLRGGDMFTHTARDDAKIVYRNLHRSGQRTTTDRVVAHAVFVRPEVASVGLTEPQARTAGHDIAIGIQEFEGIAKARAMGQTGGLIKFIVNHRTDKILGCHIAGVHAGELIHEAALAMVANISYSTIGEMIHVHPTLSEGVNSAAGGVHRPSSE